MFAHSLPLNLYTKFSFHDSAIASDKSQYEIGKRLLGLVGKSGHEYSASETADPCSTLSGGVVFFAGARMLLARKLA